MSSDYGGSTLPISSPAGVTSVRTCSHTFVVTILGVVSSMASSTALNSNV